MSNKEQSQARSPTATQAAESENQFLDAVIRARNGLRFGSIEITVHEGKVTQVERREKFRLQP